MKKCIAELEMVNDILKKPSPYSQENDRRNRYFNRLNHKFRATSINQKRCTDITYISTAKEGWTCLSSMMNLHSKKIIGYAYARLSNPT